MTSSEPIFLIDDQAPYTGIGAFTRKIFEGLRPHFPGLRWLDLGYLPNGEPAPLGRERPPFVRYARGASSVERTRADNRRRLRESGVTRNARVHLCGADYSAGADASRRVVTVHDYYYRGVNVRSLFHPRQLLTDLYQNRLNLRLGRELAGVDAVVVPSRHVQEALQRRLGVATTVVPQWVDTERFRPRPMGEARTALGLPASGPIVLSVGAGTWNKNLGTMERVVRRLPVETTTVKLGAPLNARGRGRLHRARVPPELYPLYFNAADAYLHTSREEGFGLPLLEALASGTPVVAPPDSGAREIVGDLGFYVDDPFDLPGYLRQLPEALRQADSAGFVTACVRRAGAFSAEVALRSYAEVYRRAFGP